MAATRDRKLNTFIQVSVVHPAEHILTRYSSTEIVEVRVSYSINMLTNELLISALASE